MLRAKTMFAAIMTAMSMTIVMLFGTISPASAACSSNCGRVTSGEFWHNLAGDYASDFEDMAGAQAYQVDDWGGGEHLRWYYANPDTFTHYTVAITIHTEWKNNHNVITNLSTGVGGKWQWWDGGKHTYPVGCTGTPC